MVRTVGASGVSVRALVVTGLLALLLGVLVNGAVAWMIASRGPSVPNPTPGTWRSHADSPTWIFTSNRRFGYSCTSFWPEESQGDAAAWAALTGAPAPNVPAPSCAPELRHSWSMLRDRPPPVNDQMLALPQRWVEVEVGWPMLAFRGSAREDRMPTWFIERRWVIQRPPRQRPAAGGPPFFIQTAPPRATLLPLRPILPSLLVNMLFYAAVLFPLIFAALFGCRTLRRRRCRCEKCAYPIGTSSTCTECGARHRGCPPRKPVSLPA